MTHLTTEEAAAVYRISPEHFRRLSREREGWPQPIVVSRRVYWWDEAEVRAHFKSLKRRAR